VNSEKIAEEISMTIGIILFSLAMLYIIFSSIKYNYPNYSIKFLLEISIEVAISIFALLLYIIKLEKIKKSDHLIK
jgi:hypothetical protein